MCNMKREQFEVLNCLYDKDGVQSADAIAEAIHIKADKVACILRELQEKKYVHDFSITNIGFNAMEPYRVKRAVFVAAGFGTRLVPVTLNTPKPLVRVHGKRIIDGLLDAVIAAGIEEIYIVRGYLAEQFDQLLYKYPMIQFIENPAYNETNNISSALCARYLFANAYVFEADLLLQNPKVIRKYQYCSNFLGLYKERSDDWCFTLQDGYIATHKIGGVDCFQELGISYWDEESGKKLAFDIKNVYEMPGGKELFWTQVPLKVCHEHYAVEVSECSEGDIIEIDTFRELKKIDQSYDT